MVHTIRTIDIISWIDGCIEAFYSHRHSALGIMESIATDYSALDLDATQIQSKLAEPQNMELLKSVLTKLG